MATATQVIDGETAELVVTELGHRPKRVSESDIEIGLSGDKDEDENLEIRKTHNQQIAKTIPRK